jgi:hypothetical protein
MEIKAKSQIWKLKQWFKSENLSKDFVYSFKEFANLNSWIKYTNNQL